MNGGFIFINFKPSIPFFDEITIVPNDNASIILTLVPEPKLSGTHIHFE